MGFLEANKACFRKYFVMSGRARRAEYWWWILGVFCWGIVAFVADWAVFGYSEEPGPIQAIINLMVLAPGLCVFVRRLHDTGRSGWYFWTPIAGAAAGIAFGAIFGPSLGQSASIGVGLIIIAPILLSIWWLTRPSEPGPNRYGPNPLEVTA